MYENCPGKTAFSSQCFPPQTPGSRSVTDSGWLCVKESSLFPEDRLHVSSSWVCPKSNLRLFFSIGSLSQLPCLCHFIFQSLRLKNSVLFAILYLIKSLPQTILSWKFMYLSLHSHFSHFLQVFFTSRTQWSLSLMNPDFIYCGEKTTTTVQDLQSIIY